MGKDKIINIITLYIRLIIFMEKRLYYSTAVNQVLFCVLFLSLMAQISIPLQPIPITLQSVAVMVIGLKFSCKVSMNSLFMYLALGAIGCPIFSDFSGGYQVLFGPRGGYLIGFIPAVIVMSSARFTHNSFISTFLRCLAGTVTIFTCGIVNLLATGISIEYAMRIGLFPFIIPGMIKIFLLVIILQYLDTKNRIQE